MMDKELYIELQDTQWQLDYIDHDRNIARAIVYDDNGTFYFVRADRDDDFGKATLIETAGGGVEIGEDLQTAIKRELKEELGVSVEIVCKIGVVVNKTGRINYMNVIEILFSPTGGTEKVAHIIGEHWSNNTERIDLCDSKIDFTKCNITKDDMVLIAMPSFGGRAPVVAIERLKQIRGNGAKCTLVCAV